MAPLPSATPLLSRPPQMNTDLPIATDADFDRAAIVNGGEAIRTQPPSQRFERQERPALQAFAQPELPAVGAGLPPPPDALLGAPPSEDSPASETLRSPACDPELPPWSSPAGSS